MKNYEKKLEEAKNLLDKLNDPEITLYDAMQFYKKGSSILDEATKILEEAQLEYKEMNK
jgi:exodeoxyribonuclease VII small subunit